jgi:aspartyl/asparaginyl beta-hydroxylase (cupin superfamily)
MQSPDHDQRLRQARQAASEGNLELADTLYAALVTRAGSRLEATRFLAFHRFAQQRFDESCRFAMEALALRPDDRSRVNLALSQFGMGDYAACEATLALLGDRQLGYAPLLRGALHHRRDEGSQALACFESCMPGFTDGKAGHAALPPLIARLFALAAEVRNASLQSMHRRMLDGLLERHGEEALRRIRRAIVHFHAGGEAWQHQLQQPVFFYVPGLPPRPWFEREEFAWVRTFEQRADAIRLEYDRVIAGRGSRLMPYVTAHQNAPRDSWGHLIDTDGWLSLHLLKGGRRVEPNASDMPTTMAALELIDLPRCAGNCPEAFFSVLAPRTRIPPHHGLTNYKLVGHLALDIPADCAIRVGGQARPWQRGHCLFFDDSFVHEAWNDSEERRTVLIFDVWHPALTAIERSALTLLSTAIDAFYEYRLSVIGG